MTPLRPRDVPHVRQLGFVACGYAGGCGVFIALGWKGAATFCGLCWAVALSCQAVAWLFARRRHARNALAGVVHAEPRYVPGSWRGDEIAPEAQPPLEITPAQRARAVYIESLREARSRRHDTDF